MDNTWIYPNSYQLAAVPLRKDVVSPLSPRNDDEGEKEKKEKDKAKEKEKGKDTEKKKPDDKERKKKDEPQLDDKKDDAKKDGKKEESSDDEKDKKGDDKDEKKDDKPPKPVEIDVADFERRAVILPPKPGYFGDLTAVNGKLIYRRLPRAGSGEEKGTLVYYELEKREDKTILEDVDESILAAKGEKLLVRRKNEYAIIEPKETQKFEKKLPVSGLETVIDPEAEWTQLFTDAWRLERDYFYDPNMHGVDWKAMRQRYGEMLKG